MSVLARITNIVLPFSCYLFAMTLIRNCGKMIFLLFPIMFLAAFQIVLLFLYGQSIIAVDMFLNLATTNSTEVFELLNNLVGAILTVVLIYVPPVVYAIYVLCCKCLLSKSAMILGRKIAYIGLTGSAMLFVLASACDKDYDLSEYCFPINVSKNALTAINRTIRVKDYLKTSSGFNYEASSLRSENLREIHVMVIGETSRANNWGLNGYCRNTTPLLANREDVVFFDDVMTESNTTHKSVPMLMSSVSAQNYDSIYSRKSVLTAYNEAGYVTAFISNQKPNNSLIQYFGQEAHYIKYVSTNEHRAFDTELLLYANEFIQANNDKKLFLILHCYGSHFNYRERYPKNFAEFKPDNASDATPQYRNELLNAYDNTILFTDYLLNEIIEIVDDENCCASLIYASDHGEDIYDDSQNRFLHASPVPTEYQLRVPMLIWLSPEMDSINTFWRQNANSNRHKQVSSSLSAFHTALELGGIVSPYFTKENSLINSSYAERQLVYLSDRNEVIPLNKIFNN